MVKILKPRASILVQHENYEVSIDVSDFLAEVFQSDPKRLKKVVLEGLKRSRKAQIKELADLKEKKEKLKLIFQVIDKITSTDEFKKKIAKYSPKERRMIRKHIKEAVKEVGSVFDWLDYDIKAATSRLNKLRELIMLLEETDADLVETDF